MTARNKSDHVIISVGRIDRRLSWSLIYHDRCAEVLIPAAEKRLCMWIMVYRNKGIFKSFSLARRLTSWRMKVRVIRSLGPGAHASRR